MTLVLKSNQKFTGTAIGDINGVIGSTDWSAMLNFADNRYIVAGINKKFSDVVNFTRNKIATYLDQMGNEIIAAQDVPRLNNKGLFIESPSNNVLLNSDVPASQQITLTKDQWFTYRIIGNGTINVTQANATVATGAVPQGQLGFITTTDATAKAQVTITGANSYAEVSRLYSAPTFGSLIHTISSPVGRENDLVSVKLAEIGALNDCTIVIHVELKDWQRVKGAIFDMPIIDLGFANGARISIDNTIVRTAQSATPPIQRTRIYYNGAEQAYIETADRSQSLTMAISVTANSVTIAKNGVMSGTQSFLGAAVSEMVLGRAASWTGIYAALDGFVSHVAIYKRAMSDSELAAVSKSWV
ncbi:hypothetical protein [Psychrobacter alimentarius]|uniref:hypothetical protein n=1 Tax=Psychrobacter alimentarius TaxID=261164 RepID=UPI003FD41294